MRERKDKMFFRSRGMVLTTAVLAIAVGASAGLTAAALASGPSARKARHSRSHHGGIARAASVPTGAVLKFTGGGEAIYSLRRPTLTTDAATGTGDSGDTLCLLWRRTPEGLDNHTFMGVSCGSAAQVEAEGIVMIAGANGKQQAVAALLPSGVTSVMATDSDGVSQTVPAPNNAVSINNPAVTSISYTLPDGTPHVTNLTSGG